MTPDPLKQTEKSLALYAAAKSSLGKDLCGNTDPEFGCAATLNAIASIAWGRPVGGAASTSLLRQALQDTTRFFPVNNPLPGDIVISATGLGKNPAMPNGHVGVVCVYGIVSNDSDSGLVSEKWTIPTWIEHYGVEGGYPVEYYRAL